MQMPPTGKGEPLTTEQISLLRAWIDQGASWGATSAPEQTAFSITPVVGWIGVSGDAKKFRELEGVKEGWQGGIEHFALKEQIGPDKKFSAAGHALFEQHDAELRLSLEQADTGFIRAGVQQWRRYFDDTGGFYRPLAAPSYDLDRDLHLEHLRAWIDLGLTRPDWPQLVLGYEFQSKRGTEATLQWGGVGGRNIYPSPKAIDEHTHILKFELTREWSGWLVEDSARVEFYKLATSRDNSSSFTLGPGPDIFERAQEKSSHVQGMNTFRAEKELRDWWLVSGGYLFSKYDGDASLDQTTLDANALPASGKYWSTENVTLRRDSHVVSLANLFSPADGLTATASAQGEWTHQEGFGTVHEDSGDPNLPPFTFLPGALSSDFDKTKAMEEVGLRFTKMPRTVLFAEARLEQENIGQFESDDVVAAENLLRDTQARNRLRDWRAGFSTSPWRWASLSGHYRSRVSDTDYNHLRDESLGLPDDGYSAFILKRKIQTDEIEAKLVLRPSLWLKTTFTYQKVASDFWTTTDPVPGIDPNGVLDPGYYSPGGKQFDGDYDADVYSANVTLTPVSRLFFSGTFSFSQSRTATAHNDDPSVVDYAGRTYSLIASANYTVDAATTLQASYVFSRADFEQDNVAEGLPLGINYTRHAVMAGVSRKLSQRVTASLRYRFYSYAEPTGGGANDYTAHGAFATVTVRWP
jgi:hypothetical protein